MKRSFLLLSFTALVGMVSLMGDAHAQQSPADRGVKTRGLHFDVAEDRQIENYGGVFEPETLDKYMKRKFDGVSAEIKSLHQKVDKMTGQLNEIQARLKK